MKHTPWPIQTSAVEHAFDFLMDAKNDSRQLYAAPTGVGKSVIELLLRERLLAAGQTPFVLTPKDEIVVGMLDKLGLSEAEPDSLGIWTPVKLRNRLMDGRVKHPTQWIIDESHHESAETWQQLDLLSGQVPAVGYTATPYRGSPKSTRDFLARWGEPIWIISYEEAEAAGYISMPTFSILPLVDDDIVEITNGEFSVESLEAHTVDRLGDLANHCAQWYVDSKWDKPTIFAFPSTKLCFAAQLAFRERGLPLAIVNAATPKAERWSIFQAVMQGFLALAHINVVTEGVDLPIRRIVDVAPTMSPVKWVQQLGRATRRVPEGEALPEYVCCCRNVLRHAYVLEGIIPAAAIVDAEKAFPPTNRPHVRVFGLEALGRLKPIPVKLANGTNAYVYSVSTLVNRVVVEYTCIVHPTKEPIWASKISTRKDDGTRDWGSWLRCEPPAELTGFGSVPQKELSPKQKAWWGRSNGAVCRGIDPNQEVNRKNFQVLPVLTDLGERL